MAKTNLDFFFGGHFFPKFRFSSVMNHKNPAAMKALIIGLLAVLNQILAVSCVRRSLETKIVPSAEAKAASVLEHN
jgi:hypothetical protein